MKADASIDVDITEALKKLDAVTKRLERIHELIDCSWLLRFIFYGWKGGKSG